MNFYMLRTIAGHAAVLLLGFSAVIAAAAASNTAEPVRALQPQGEFRQGAVLRFELEPEQVLVYQGEVLPKTPGGLSLLGLDRDHGAELQLVLRSPTGERALSYDIEPRDYRIQRVEGIARKIMQPSDEALTRIRAESALVKAARKGISTRSDFLERFRWPITGRITGVYGSQRVYNGRPGRPHYGVDVAGPVGAIVLAPASGKVVLVHDNMFYSGGTIILDHGQGLTSSFLHLSETLVKEGDEVAVGQKIAKVGATGRVTGPHLDWRMNWRSARVDPEMWVPVMPTKSGDSDDR